MDKNISVLVLAAGSGQRIGNNPKAFLNGAGSTLLERSVKKLSCIADEIIVGLSVDKLDKGISLLENKNVIIVEGGQSRIETIEKLTQRSSMDILVIHDVARPYISIDLFNSVILAAIENGAASTYVPASIRDGVALRKGDYFSKAFSLDEIILTQTPQAFQRDVLIDTFEKRTRHAWTESSPTALVSKAGHKVRLVEGVDENLKITYPEDLTHLTGL